MSLLFCDSFDHYTVAQAAEKYTNGSGGSRVAGRHGNGWSGGTASLGLADIGSNRCIMGCWIRPASAGSLFGPLIPGSHTPSGYLGFNGDGSLRYVVVGGGTFTSAPGVFHYGRWHFIEIDITISDSGGIVRVYVDDPAHGSPVINLTGQETIAPIYVDGNNWTGISLGYLTGIAGVMDDLYVLDSTTTDVNGLASPGAPLGAIAIEVRRPNGEGLVAEWDPTPAVANYLNVDDIQPDDDTSYNASDVPGSPGPVDLFEIEDIDTDDTIIGQQLLISAMKTAEEAGTITALVRHSGTTYDVQTALLSGDYVYACRVAMARMPNGATITDANFNAQQAGYRRDA